MISSSKTMHEQISAFADGELASFDQSGVLTALRAPAERAVWDDYHHIGDIIRSVEMAAAVHPEFAARTVALLESEPIYIEASATGPFLSGHQSWLNRSTMLGAAVAAALLLTVVAGPRLAGMQVGDALLQVALFKSDPQTFGTNAATVVLRDPRMDEYLLAHQRFSPSVFSNAQFSRSATFATESVK